MDAEGLAKLDPNRESLARATISLEPTDSWISVKVVKSKRLVRTNDAYLEFGRVSIIEPADDRLAHLVGSIEIHTNRSEVEHYLQPTGRCRQRMTQKHFSTIVR